MAAPVPRVKDWEPGPATITLWSILGSVLAIAGIFLFSLPYAVTRGGGVLRLEASVMLGGLVVTGGIFVLLLVLHEWVHGLTIRKFGGQPSYGVGVMYGFMPYFYCTAAGRRFDKKQFFAVSAAPMVVISLLGALCVAFVPYGGWLVVPLGLHLGGCIGDLWFLGVILRQPRGTLFEDLKTGVRLLCPAT